MSSQTTRVEDLESRLDALSRRVQRLEEHRDYLAEKLKEAENDNDELRRRLSAVEDDTDLLRLVDRADSVTAEERRGALLQHMWRAVRNEPDDDKVTAITVDKAEEILHYPDVDRSTVNRWVRTTPRLLGNEDVCWYDGGDAGPGGKPARLYLDVRKAGESVIENIKRQTRRPNNSR